MVLTRLLDSQDYIFTTTYSSMILRPVMDHGTDRIIDNQEAALLLLQKPIYFTNFQTEILNLNNFREFNSSVFQICYKHFRLNLY